MSRKILGPENDDENDGGSEKLIEEWKWIHLLMLKLVQNPRLSETLGNCYKNSRDYLVPP